MKNVNVLIKKIIILLFWVYIFTLLTFNGARYLDHDFGWHLRVGEDIAKTGNVPNIEYYDYTLEGQSWVDHEWLLNYLTFLIFDNFGYFFLILVFSIIAFLPFYILYLFILNKYKEYFKNNFFLQILLLIFIALGVYASLPHLGVRMQEVTLLNIVILFVVIEEYIKKKNIKILFFLPFLFLFWASAHAGFLIGLFLLGAWVSVKYFEIVCSRFSFFNFVDYSEKLGNKNLMLFSIFSFLSFLATLLTPYGTKLYSFLTSYSNDFYLTNISEWLPFYYFPFLYNQLLYAALSLAVVFLFLFFSLRKNRFVIKDEYKINIWHLFLFILFLYLAAKSRRHFPLFFVSSLPFVFLFYIKLFAESFLEFKKMVNFKIVSLFVVSVLLVMIANNVNKIAFVKTPFESFCESFPCGSVSYLNEHEDLQSKRVFNDYGWGGFLIWELPQMKLFIDGRLPQFEYNGHSMLEEYKDFFNEDCLEEKLLSHKIEVVLLKTESKKIKLNWLDKYIIGLSEKDFSVDRNYLKDYLETSSSWIKEYGDAVSSIYVKM
jgi:hypothetical protein